MAMKSKFGHPIRRTGHKADASAARPVTALRSLRSALPGVAMVRKTRHHKQNDRDAQTIVDRRCIPLSDVKGLSIHTTVSRMMALYSHLYASCLLIKQHHETFIRTDGDRIC